MLRKTRLLLSAQRLWLAVILIAASVASCRTWGRVDQFKYVPELPRSVNRGEGLIFRVRAEAPNGKEVDDISFYWSVDWVDLNGSKHKGKSAQPLKIRSKGKVGTAYVRVYAYDADGELRQVAREPFEVK